MGQKKKHIILFSIVTLTVSSCTKEINIDLNSVNPQLVVEGNISDQSGPYLVKLSQTVNYNQDDTFPAVSGAIIKITDNTGNSETLTEISSGNYYTSALQGTIGRAYNISITRNGKSYSGTSLMPVPVTIDTILVDTTNSGGFRGGSRGNRKNTKTVHVKFNDPAGIANYYRFIELVNNIAKTDIFITSDNLRDGTNIDFTLSRDTTIHAGDSVAVLLQSIDKKVYEYFRTLDQIASGGGGFRASTPDNPTSNLTNSALGYFNAFSVKSKKTRIP